MGPHRRDGRKGGYPLAHSPIASHASSPTAASIDAKVHHNTITAWLRTYPGLGRKVGGRWRV